MSDQVPENRSRTLAVVVAGVIALLVDGVGVPTSSGSEHLRPGFALLTTVPSLLAAVVGLVLLLAHRWVGATGWRRPLIALAAGLAALSLVAMSWYPRITRASIVALGEDRRVMWRTTVPATYLNGIRDANAETIEVEGIVYERPCHWDLVAMTLDRTSGRVLAVERLPTLHPPGEEPRRPRAPSPSEYVFEQGDHPFACHS